MTDYKNKPVSLWLILLAIAIIVMLSSPVWSSGTKAEAEAIASTGDQVLKGSGSTSIALGQSLGDVDLGRATDCIVTTQFGIIIYQHQRYEYDVFCLADQLDMQGKYEDAAAMRCTDKRTEKLYGDRCTEVMNFKPVVLEGFDESQRQEDDQRYELMQAQIDELQGQLEEVPEPVSTTVTRIVQQPFLSDEKRAKLQAILDEDDDER